MWNTTTALNTTAIDAPGDQVPQWVELIPSGEVVGRDGRRWLNTNPLGIIEAFQTNAMDLPVDLEHATEIKAAQGEAAPAVGWVKELQAINGAIWGRVDWNAVGSRYIADRQYRYLSPVILYSKSSGIIAGLTSVGLTNRPNLNLRALNQQVEGAGPAGSSRALNAMEQEICAKMGISAEEYIKADPRNGRNGQAAVVANALNADERLICQRMGISEEEYLKTMV